MAEKKTVTIEMDGDKIISTKVESTEPKNLFELISESASGMGEGIAKNIREFFGAEKK